MAEAPAASAAPATAVGGTGQAGAGTPPSGTAGTPAPQAPTEWTAGFSDDMRGYVQNKGWKNAQEVADSYRNFEKNYAGVGQERLLKLPESMDSAEGRAVWEKLGMPKTPQEYGLDKIVAKELGDSKFAERAAAAFHEAGITKLAAEKIVSKWNVDAKAIAEATTSNQRMALTQATEKLKTEWGAAYEKNMNLAKSGMMALELDTATVDLMANVMGAEKVFKQLSKIGAGIGEASFVAGRPAGDGTVTPEQARNELEELKRDQSWVQKYLAGDFDAKKRMEHLQKMAVPGDMRLT